MDQILMITGQALLLSSHISRRVSIIHLVPLDIACTAYSVLCVYLSVSQSVCLSVCLSVCVSVCLSVHAISADSFVCRLKARYQWLAQESSTCGFVYCLEVVASFAYRESHQPCYIDPEFVPSTAQGYKVAEKPNRMPSTT